MITALYNHKQKKKKNKEEKLNQKIKASLITKTDNYGIGKLYYIGQKPFVQKKVFIKNNFSQP